MGLGRLDAGRPCSSGSRRPAPFPREYACQTHCRDHGDAGENRREQHLTAQPVTLLEVPLGLLASDVARHASSARGPAVTAAAPGAIPPERPVDDGQRVSVIIREARAKRLLYGDLVPSACTYSPWILRSMQSKTPNWRAILRITPRLISVSFRRAPCSPSGNMKGSPVLDAG
jgi:hypothetical protein